MECLGKAAYLSMLLGTVTQPRMRLATAPHLQTSPVAPALEHHRMGSRRMVMYVMPQPLQMHTVKLHPADPVYLGPTPLTLDASNQPQSLNKVRRTSMQPQQDCRVMQHQQHVCLAHQVAAWRHAQQVGQLQSSWSSRSMAKRKCWLLLAQLRCSNCCCGNMSCSK